MEQAEMSEGKRWLVIQAETCEGDGGLWTAATAFSDFDEAVKFVEHVVRDEWQVVVDLDVSPRPLADCRGYTYPEGPVKRSQVHYEDDGTVAWATLDSGGSMSIKVVEDKQKGERIC